MKRLLVLLTLVAVVVAGLVIFNPLALLPAAEVEPGPPLRETAQASVRDLSTTFEAEAGDIVFDGERPVTDPQPGTIGWIAEPEQELAAGDVLYERDLQPVVFMVGDVPAWRSMGRDDVGEDVAQLEANLLALGYGTESDFTVDDTFTSATEVIVERWQADLGVEQTGSVALGDVVFGPADARVGTVSAAVGDSTAAVAPLLVLSSQERELVFTIGAETIGFIAEGTEVNGQLPDRSNVAASVTSITPAGGGLSTVTAELSDTEAALPLGDAIPVSVSWSETLAVDAVTVPATALIRLDSGQYVVEVVERSGETGLVVVEPGDRFGTSVHIEEGIEAGTTVVAP